MAAEDNLNVLSFADIAYPAAGKMGLGENALFLWAGAAEGIP